MSYKILKFSSGIIFYKLNFTLNINLLNSSNFNINAFLYRLTLNESFYKSGFYLNNLHNFFVLYFNIIDNFAI